MWAKINPVITAPIEGAACSMPSPCAPIFRTSLANIGNSAGVEAKKVLKKSYQNEQMIKVSEYLKKAGIPLSINNIIGFPDETRELIFDTIELNRQMNFDTTNAYAFTPFHGTALYDYCLKKGYIEPDALAGCLTKDTVKHTMLELHERKILIFVVTTKEQFVVSINKNYELWKI